MVGTERGRKSNTICSFMNCIFHLVVVEPAKIIMFLATIDLKKQLHNQVDETTKLERVAQNLESKMKSIETNSEDFHNEISEIKEGKNYFTDKKSDLEGEE